MEWGEGQEAIKYGTPKQKVKLNKEVLYEIQN